MKEIKVNIPTEFTIEHYQKLGQFEHLSEIEKIIRIVSAISSYDEEFIRSWDLSSLQKIYVDLHKKIIDTQAIFLPIFEFEGIKYGLQPISKMSAGEYIDLDTFIGDWENIEKAMAVLYRPVVNKIKDKYTIEEYKVGVDQEILDMPMDAVLSSIFFLWNLGLDLSKTMMNYLDKDQTQALTQYLTSQPNGAGITQFTDLLKETLQDMKISLN